MTDEAKAREAYRGAKARAFYAGRDKDTAWSTFIGSDELADPFLDAHLALMRDNAQMRRDIAENALLRRVANDLKAEQTAEIERLSSMACEKCRPGQEIDLEGHLCKHHRALATPEQEPSDE